MSRENKLFYGIWYLVVTVLFLLILYGAFRCTRAYAHEPPFEYDPNNCVGMVMDSAYSEPNVPVIYSVSLYFPVADPNLIDVNEMQMQVSEPNDVNDFLIQYHGVQPVIPLGYIHSWTTSFTPRIETLYYINFQANYTYQMYAGSSAWGFDADKKSRQTVTGVHYSSVILKCTSGERPYLQPGPTPSGFAMAARHYQYAKKRGRDLGRAIVWR